MTVNGDVGGDVYGGQDYHTDATAAMVERNAVTVSGGTIGYRVYGGYAWSGSGNAAATGNTVTVSGGTIDYRVYGGYARSSSGSAAATGNAVTVSGGTIDYNVYGGYVDSDGTSGDALNNRIVIGGGTVFGNIYGGYSLVDGYGETGTAIGNAVTLSGSPDLTASSLYGGFVGEIDTPEPDTNSFTGNTLKVWDYTGSSVVSVRNFQYYDFVLPASMHDGGVLLDVTGDAYFNGSAQDSTSSTYGDDSFITGVNIMAGGAALSAGDKVTLMEYATRYGVAINGNDSIRGRKGVSLLYDFQLSQDAVALTAEVVGVRANPEAKSLSEGRAASLAFVRQGQDHVVRNGVAAAEAAASGHVGAGWSGPSFFAGLAGGRFRHQTGSRVDIGGASLLAGLAWRNGGPGRSLLLGIFFDAGYADYDTHNAFASGAVRGDGDSRYFGGGLLARHDWQNGFHAEASARAGVMKNRFASDLTDMFGNRARYDVSSAYFGAHAGAGYQWRLNDRAVLDLSGEYLWSRQNGGSVVAAGDPVRFEPDDSRRLRAGARLAYALNDSVSPYAGAAFEYEFDGRARAGAYGYNYGVPSLKGGSGVGEIGLTVRRGRFTADLGAQGHIGRRTGVTGGLRVGWVF
ncbi:MAG: autotransporter outer membrane beta-barrel domain-containing protein [Planctomycetota bacterium]|nr:autotransporter outer membrane beta-barrel domain-containing protein [Planctomycetota bacterium]